MIIAVDQLHACDDSIVYFSISNHNTKWAPEFSKYSLEGMEHCRPYKQAE